jgi:PAS domain S-box-containing protein
MAEKVTGWARHVGDQVPYINRLNIGRRLTLCFVAIICAMLAGNAILLWEFGQAAAQAERLGGVDQELVAVQQAHISLMSFYERLDLLAQSENTSLLVNEVEALRDANLEASRRSRNALSQLPGEVQTDPTLLPTLVAIQDALPAQLDAIIALARSGEWGAVRLRLVNQVRPLEARSAALVENIDRSVNDARAQAISNIRLAQRRILVILPITAILTFLFAGFLGLSITRSITQPLGRLMEGSSAVASGDFNHRVPAVGNDEIARLGGFFNDMVVRLQQLYRELQRRESYLAEAQRISHTGSFGWNVSTEEIYWSQETFRIFEYEPTTKITIDLILQRVHPQDRSAVQELIERASRERQEFDLEHRLVMPSGSVKHLRVVGHPSTDEEGRFEFVGAVTDITERKCAEEALRQAQAREYSMRLEERVAERERIARELHDTLLQSVQGLILKLDAITRQIPKEDAAHSAIESVLDHADRVLAEARDRVRSLRATPVPLRDLQAAFQEVAEEASKESEATFKTVVEGTVRNLHPIVLEECFAIGREALINAFRHSAGLRIEVEIAYDPRQFRLRVRDDGHGFDPRVLEDGNCADHWGLQGMRERADRIGAQLDLLSTPGSGTDVELTIPADTAYLSPQAKPADSQLHISSRG